MFVDGFAGNVETRIVGITNAFQLDIDSKRQAQVYFYVNLNASVSFHINGAR